MRPGTPRVPTKGLAPHFNSLWWIHHFMPHFHLSLFKFRLYTQTRSMFLQPWLILRPSSVIMPLSCHWAQAPITHLHRESALLMPVPLGREPFNIVPGQWAWKSAACTVNLSHSWLLAHRSIPLYWLSPDYIVTILTTHGPTRRSQSGLSTVTDTACGAQAWLSLWPPLNAPISRFMSLRNITLLKMSSARPKPAAYLCILHMSVPFTCFLAPLLHTPTSIHCHSLSRKLW